MTDFPYGINRIIAEIAAIGTGQVSITPTNDSIAGVPVFGYKSAGGVAYRCAVLDAAVRFTDLEATGIFTFGGTSSTVQESGMTSAVSFTDILENKTRSKNTEFNFNRGDITNIQGGIKPLDPINLSELHYHTSGTRPVLSTIDASPTLANETIGNRYLVGAGTGDFLNHDDETTEVVGIKIDPTAVDSGGVVLDRNDKSLAYSPSKKIYVVVGTDGFSYSYDNKIFFAAATPSAEAWTKVKEIPEWGVFIACATIPATNAFAVSRDGKNWIGVPGIFKNYKGLAFLPPDENSAVGTLFAFASTGSPRLSYTYDGFNWNESGITITEETWNLGDYSEKQGRLVAATS